MTKNERRRLLWIGVTILILLAGFVVFSPTGVLKYYRLRGKISELQSQNSTMEKEIKTLRTEINKLKTDPEYIENLAREQGFIKENEILFDFSKIRKKKDEAADE